MSKNNIRNNIGTHLGSQMKIRYMGVTYAREVRVLKRNKTGINKGRWNINQLRYSLLWCTSASVRKVYRHYKVVTPLGELTTYDEYEALCVALGLPL